MVAQFSFASAGRIIFGSGQRRVLAEEVTALGKRPFLVTGANPERSLWLKRMLLKAGISSSVGSVAGEPTVETVTRLAELAQGGEADCIIALGGGSVIDAAKALAAILSNPGPIQRYLEVIGEGQPILKKPLPCVAVPTTSGTGAEVTRNAVICCPEQRVKVSMRDYSMLPDLVVIDPELTLSLPPDITASTGLDALTQLIEAFLTRRANPLTDGLCREGIARAGQALPLTCRDPGNLAARESMALASLFSGLALANAGLGAVHGFAGPLGGLFPIPHGIVCANLLSPVMALNFKALSTRDPENERLDRFREIAVLLTGNRNASAFEGIEWIRELVGTLPLPPMTGYGISEDDLPLIVGKSMHASSMKGNPVELFDFELTEVLRKILFEK